ncbi:MAG TPA: hypothetical protein VFS12_00760, partial [Terriglobia bacterium]|nr:hypothetical protein [Terriglobia bacterium]
RGSRSWTETVEGAATQGDRFNFSSSSLPRNEVRVDVRKRDGRGKVRVVESPSRRNDYTAIIEIEDDTGGADNYEIEVEWN